MMRCLCIKRSALRGRIHHYGRSSTFLLSHKVVEMVKIPKSAAAASGIFCAFFSANASAFRNFDASHRPSSRYFTLEQTLPALSPHVHENQTEILPYSSSCHAYSKPLPVVYTNNPAVVSNWLGDNIPTSNGILGFDVESVPRAPWIESKASFLGPATVQLATTDSCLVVHLLRRNGRSSKSCAPILESVLADSSIIKAGAGIDLDLVDLASHWETSIQAKSRLDISGIGVTSKSETIGLARLTKSILGVDLGKTRKIAMSDWSQIPLTDAQLSYSARDAWAGAAIVSELASIAPETFGTDPLVELLKNERPMQDLIETMRRRKKAKTQIASIEKRFRKQTSRHAPFRRQQHQMPIKVKNKISNLKREVAKSSIGGCPMVFDVEPLGLKIHPTATSTSNLKP